MSSDNRSKPDPVHSKKRPKPAARPRPRRQPQPKPFHCWLKDTSYTVVRRDLGPFIRGQIEPNTAANPKIYISETIDSDLEFLEVAIHEMLHGCDWSASERKVKSTAFELSEALYAMGARLDQSLIPSATTRRRRVPQDTHRALPDLPSTRGGPKARKKQELKAGKARIDGLKPGMSRLVGRPDGPDFIVLRGTPYKLVFDAVEDGYGVVLDKPTAANPTMTVSTKPRDSREMLRSLIQAALIGGFADLPEAKAALLAEPIADLLDGVGVKWPNAC